MNSLFLAEAMKLKNIQIFLEKNDNLIYLSKHGDESDLSNYVHQTEKNRKAEQEQVINEVKNIWNSLQAKKKALKEELDSLDLKSFKKDLIIIQDKIFNMKIKLNMNVRTLKDQEKDSYEVLQMYNPKLEEWEKFIKILANVNYRINSNVSTYCSDNKEVKKFMDFINKSNGYENGWCINDHQLFLKFRNKYKNKETLAINLNKALPDISPSSIKEHEIWYRKYLELKTKKDDALQKWRQAKSINTQLEDNANDDARNKPKNSSILKPINENIQEKLALWKAEKEAKRQQEQIHGEVQKEKVKRIEEEKRKLHEEIKQSVAKWKEAKVVKEQTEKFERDFMQYHEKKLKAAEANKLIKIFQSHDDIFISRMRNNKLPQKNDIRRTKSSYMSNRDPQRVFKPTKQWLIRISKDNLANNERSISIPNIKTIPKLRIPEWRKKIANNWTA